MHIFGSEIRLAKQHYNNILINIWPSKNKGSDIVDEIKKKNENFQVITA